MMLHINLYKYVTNINVAFRLRPSTVMNDIVVASKREVGLGGLLFYCIIKVRKHQLIFKITPAVVTLRT